MHPQGPPPPSLRLDSLARLLASRPGTANAWPVVVAQLHMHLGPRRTRRPALRHVAWAGERRSTGWCRQQGFDGVAAHVGAATLRWSARPCPEGSHSEGCGAALTAGLQLSWRRPVDRRLEVAAPLEVGSHLRSSQLVQGDAVATGRPQRTARPLRDLQGLLPLPAMARQRNQGGAKVSHPVHQDRPIPLEMVGQQHQRRTLGERTAATLVPIASTAKTTRPPRTSVKYPRSAATSRLGVYTKSSCWKGTGWSVTAPAGDDRASHRTRAPGQGALARLINWHPLRSGSTGLTAKVCTWTGAAEPMWYMKALMREVGEFGQHQRWPPKVDRGLSVELQCGANQQLRGHVRLCAPFRFSWPECQRPDHLTANATEPASARGPHLYVLAQARRPRAWLRVPMQRSDGWHGCPRVTGHTRVVMAVRLPGAASHPRCPSAGACRGLRG